MPVALFTVWPARASPAIRPTFPTPWKATWRAAGRALGFGVRDKTDITFLTGKVDIAVIGSQTLRIVDEKGVDAVGDFISGLR